MLSKTIERSKEIKNFFLFFFFLAALLSMNFADDLFAADDAIIAVVNDETITLKDLKEYLNAIYLQLVSDGKNEEQIQKIMTDYEINGIDQLIDDKLLVDEANKKQMQIRPKLIDERLLQMKSHYPSEKEFLDALAEDGLTVGDLKNRVTDQLKKKYIIETQVRSQIQVNPQEVTDYYQKHFTEFQSAEKVDLDSIFVAYKDNRDEAATKANQALGLLKQGRNFLEVDKEFSDAPSIGLIEKGQLLPALEETIFKLKESEASALVETDKGIYIFKVNKKIPAKASTLEDAKDQIDNILFQKKFQDRLGNWLKDLRKKAYVEVKS